MIGRDALRGYVLEEVVAKMLQLNGYRLLNDERDDPEAFITRGHTLYVKGRGSDHQADALGDLTAPIPFGLPVRLFVEAKHYRQPVDLPVLRNAHGVIHDVNQCYATPRTGARRAQRYDYRYAVFSTSGFTRPADDFAQAHQISLHDLSEERTRPLLDAIAATADGIRDAARAAKLTEFPLHALRLALRAALGTLATPPTSTTAAAPTAADISARLRTARALHPALEALDPLAHHGLSTSLAVVTAEAPGWAYLVGYSEGPSVLAMRPDDVRAFELHCSGTDDVPVQVSYEPARRTGRGEFVLTPEDRERPRFQLRFGAPDVVVRDVLTVPEPSDPQAAPVRRTAITVFQQQRAIRLSYVPRQVPRDADANQVADLLRDDPPAPAALTEPSAVQEEEIDLLDVDIDEDEDEDDADTDEALADAAAGTWVPWTPSEARRFRGQLEQRSPDRAALLRALTEGRRRGLNRAEVLEAMGRDASASLNGVVKPFGTVVRALKRAGQLGEDKESPVEPRTRRGRVVGYRLRSEVREALRRAR
ncbi:restriction endonuclease [Streptomyces sp. NP160]|uniref:restriction endonuclease n=1 Tax=Streptomyces sp. NP160 TaxID=2586637 RepID=UPI00111AF0C9|nr:restriction endonuclease [Streptomyces sp. NP160]TNM59617.1 restriction endonuclease [Streptomyces sp. NP160]